MFGCVFWAIRAHNTEADLFWPEVIALKAFAISWLVKGYAHQRLWNGVKRARRAFRL